MIDGPKTIGPEMQGAGYHDSVERAVPNESEWFEAMINRSEN